MRSTRRRARSSRTPSRSIRRGPIIFNLCTADFQVGKFGEALEVCKRVAATHPAATVQTKTDKLIARIREEAKNQHIKLD